MAEVPDDLGVLAALSVSRPRNEKASRGMSTDTATWTERLADLHACREARTWANDYASLAEAWAACERGDWMLWLSGRVSGAPESEARKLLVLCACACARTALRHTTDARVVACIETAERWARGEASLDDVRAARRNAYAAAYAAYAADAAAAAARQSALKACADIVREHYPTPPEWS
jgi:hypothetical protein